ncbi:3674_t:CDS:1 [Acaulospora morrowiae]|uniref:3674_t:CDS:1 n=1 Tax=Acaulospora morrowiae TaxID=94023 RepID=A0A9N9E5S4_9GLOM|nr:3674_t:CDS:1 [Acaulospora morrowiae]
MESDTDSQNSFDSQETITYKVDRYKRKIKNPQTTNGDNGAIARVVIYEEYMRNPASLRNVFHETRPYPELIKKVRSLNLDYSTILMPNIRVTWKGGVKDYSNYPLYNYLHICEREMCNIMRLTPQKYLQCLYTIVTTFRELKDTFKRSQAKKICDIDVNKISVLYEVLEGFGWV